MSMLLYNPDRKGKDQLIAEFVVRNDIYDEIISDLESSAMQHPEQHYLLVGQRGTGKTTLLNRIKFGVEDSPVLRSTLIPVIFSEEQYHITDLGNLWESIANYLEDFHRFTGISKEIESIIGTANFEELSFDILEKHLVKHQKKVLLLLDNLGDILKKLDKNEIHRFREILQTKAELRLIAGSPFYLESTIDYHQPFYEFFKIIHLDGLTQQETEKLLLKLGEIHGEQEKIQHIIKESPERISILRMLTGGIPRTIALMFKIFVNSNDEGSVKDLEQILDAVTPLYKHRMDDLPPQQQKIMHAVAINWDAISVKELKDKVRIEGKIVSAQLKQLEKNQVIEKIETSTKNHLYMVKERFFNIWYLMRYGRKDDKQKVIWLVRFLESWCSNDDLKERIISYLDKIKTNQLDDQTASLFGHAYASLKALDTDVKVRLKVNTPQTIASGIILSEVEIINSINKKIKNKEWVDLFNMLLKVEPYTESIKLKYFFCISEIERTEEAKYLTKDYLDNFRFFNLEQYTAAELEVIKSIVMYYLREFIYFDVDATENALEIFLYLSDHELVIKNSFAQVYLGLLFCLMLAKKQYNLLSKIFKETTRIPLMEVFKPIYYASVLLKEGPDSTEFLKAGPEIQESIQDILKKVNDLERINHSA